MATINISIKLRKILTCITLIWLSLNFHIYNCKNKSAQGERCIARVYSSLLFSKIASGVYWIRGWMV
jgi:hypothetical protein